jgi:hypothetical protein
MRVFQGVEPLRWRRVLQALGGALWLGLVTWKLPSVPGMSMDEAWSILSAQGQWPPENPLSGMTSYSGPFPVLLLELFGADYALYVLRGASVLANAAMLVCIGLMLRRLYPANVLAAWALPVIATCPVWLVVMRTGIDVAMFTPPLAVLGLYLCMRGTRWAAFAAGLSWGLLIYNHLLGLWFPVSIALAWLMAYWRLPNLAWGPAFGGLGLGVLPRLVAIATYYERPLTGSGAKYSVPEAIADLRWLPQVFWEALSGTSVYLRYVGRVAVEVWPYWLVAALMLVPWVRHWRRIPRHAWFTLVAVVCFCVLITVGAPYMAVRFFVLPALGLSAFVVLLGASAIELDRRWALLVRGVAGLLVLGNLFYLLSDFYLPWQRRELGVTSFFLGARSPRTGSWVYLPKDELARKLRELTPLPEQIVTNESLSRPLRVLLSDTGVRVASWDVADKNLRSVLVDYRSGRSRNRYCGQVANGKMCFAHPSVVDGHFVMYR